MNFNDLKVSFKKPYIWRQPTEKKLTKKKTYNDLLSEIGKFDKLKIDIAEEVNNNMNLAIKRSNTENELSFHLTDMFEQYSKAVIMTDDYDEKYLLTKTNQNTLNKKLQPWCRNLLFNIPRVIDSPPLLNLFNKFKDVPAFVILAGPSLRHNIKQLKDIGDKGLVISTDTAFRPCLEAGVKVHLVMAHDANPQGMRFFLPKEHPFQNPQVVYNDMPFEMLISSVYPALQQYKKQSTYKYDSIGVFVNYCHPLTIESFNGSDACFYQVFDPALPVYGMMGGCTNWRKEGDKYVPEQKGMIVGGSSVGHTAVYLALNLDCNPISIIGCDLSYPEGLTYIPGASNQKDATKQRLITVKDLSGRDVGTNLSMFSYRIVFQRALPTIIEQSDKQFFNCTEHEDGSPAGILEVGAEPKKLKEVISEYCKEEITDVKRILQILRKEEGEKVNG